jgi:hypothetical protein
MMQHWRHLDGCARRDPRDGDGSIWVGCVGQCRQPYKSLVIANGNGNGNGNGNEVVGWLPGDRIKARHAREMAASGFPLALE